MKVTKTDKKQAIELIYNTEVLDKCNCKTKKEGFFNHSLLNLISNKVGLSYMAFYK